MTQLAECMGRLGTETAFEVLQRARQMEAKGRSMIHLEIGEPDFDTPAHIVEAAVAALRRGETHYTPAAGIPPLRQAIAKYISDTRGIAVDEDQVVVVPGGKPIIFYTIMGLCQAGDEVIYPNPGFPIYESMINFVGATPVPIPLRMEKGFSFDLDEFRSLLSPRTKLVILNSPQNPTGGILSADELRALAAMVQETDAVVLSDEIYSRILYEGEFASIASVPGMASRTIILDGFSKTYAMTGWRLGYGVMPRELAPHMTRLMVNSNSCSAAFTQHAAVAALEGDQSAAEEMVKAFAQRRDVVVRGLADIPGFRCACPKGAFYAFPNIAETGLSAREMQDYLLEKAGVATLAGTSFGKYGEGFIRLSYANSVENLQEALRRIRTAVEALPGRA
ncbi:MAG: pyridoxal phosphate-dependent aminotransferase [Chloroflexi bacterium]|nr:pyridoxal phosphate-dependent aminotransferase [Chloroflexota bacterium]